VDEKSKKKAKKEEDRRPKAEVWLETNEKDKTGLRGAFCCFCQLEGDD